MSPESYVAGWSEAVTGTEYPCQVREKGQLDWDVELGLDLDLDIDQAMLW